MTRRPRRFQGDFTRVMWNSRAWNRNDANDDNGLKADDSPKKWREEEDFKSIGLSFLQDKY
jgi:hypothetical protein